MSKREMGDRNDVSDESENLEQRQSITIGYKKKQVFSHHFKALENLKRELLCDMKQWGRSKPF